MNSLLKTYWHCRLEIDSPVLPEERIPSSPYKQDDLQSDHLPHSPCIRPCDSKISDELSKNVGLCSLPKGSKSLGFVTQFPLRHH